MDVDDFEKELKLGFLDEAAQSVTDVEQCFLQIESNPDDKSVLDKIFRLAHNLKGSSRAVGFDQMGHFTHEFESFLLKLKNGELAVSPDIISLMLRCNDHLNEMIQGLKDNLEASFDSSDLITQIENFKSGAYQSSSSENEAPVIDNMTESEGEILTENLFQNLKSSEDIVNEVFDQPAEVSAASNVSENTTTELASIPVEQPVTPPVEEDDFAAAVALLQKVDTITHQNFAEGIDPLKEATARPEIIEKTATLEIVPPVVEPAAVASAPKPAPAQTPAPAPAASSAPKAPAAGGSAGAPGNKSSGAAAVDESIRVSLSRVESLQNYVGEMVILQSVLREQVSDSTSLLLKRTAHQLGKVVKEIQDITMSLRMVPVRPTFQKMQRIVRDTAQALGKDVNLRLVGEDTELDKTVLEKINDPLVHLIRNSVDHGVESADIRISRGKKAQGEVKLSAFHQGGKLVIEVSDDGGGLDAKKLKDIAIKKGVIKPGTNLSEVECWNLIFAPGFSTKEQTTDISGRGVGMDVVRTNIEELSGEIQIESVLGVGTTFRVFLPLTLAIIDGMIVRCSEERYVIPLSHVHESVQPTLDQVKHTTGLGDILLLRGENLPIFRLGKLYGRKSETAINQMIAIVIRSSGDPFVLLVDDIIGQSQVVVKQLGPELQFIKGVSGSTILGDGRPALIVEPSELIKKGKSQTRTDLGRAV